MVVVVWYCVYSCCCWFSRCSCCAALLRVLSVIAAITHEHTSLYCHIYTVREHLLELYTYLTVLHQYLIEVLTQVFSNRFQV